MVSTIYPIVKDPKKFLEGAGGLDKDMFDKLNEAGFEQERKVARKEAEALQARSNKELEKAMDKIMSDQLKAFVDARLKALEAMVFSLMKTQR